MRTLLLRVAHASTLLGKVSTVSTTTCTHFSRVVLTVNVEQNGRDANEKYN